MAMLTDQRIKAIIEALEHRLATSGTPPPGLYAFDYRQALEWARGKLKDRQLRKAVAAAGRE